MKKNIILLLITGLIIVFFTGCGTTTQLVDEEDNNDIEIAPKSESVVNTSVEYTSSGWVTGTTSAAVCGATVEVYKYGQATDENLIAVTKVTAPNGSFVLDLGTNTYSVIYISQLEPGKRRSDYVTKQK